MMPIGSDWLSFISCADVSDVHSDRLIVIVYTKNQKNLKKMQLIGLKQ